MTVRLAFFASHNGSSAQAITRACEAALLKADPVLLISNNPDCPAFVWAKEHKIKTYCLNEKLCGTAENLDLQISHILHDHVIDMAICSGYMKLIGTKTIQAVKGKIINVHPALLPRHGGKGMYGRKIHEAVIAEHDAETGITLHWVDAEYDHGRIIAQHRIAVETHDTVETIESRVKKAEPDFYIETLKKIVSDFSSAD
jgi:phosphoribosylglycinamide formyltransferase-1